MTITGDLNNDGKLDAEDLKLLRNLLTDQGITEGDIEALSREHRALLDVNGDGRVDEGDVAALCKTLMRGDAEKADAVVGKLNALRGKLKS